MKSEDFRGIAKDDGNVEIHKQRWKNSLTSDSQNGNFFSEEFHEKLSGMSQGEIGTGKIKKCYSLGG